MLDPCVLYTCCWHPLLQGAPLVRFYEADAVARSAAGGASAASTAAEVGRFDVGSVPLVRAGASDRVFPRMQLPLNRDDHHRRTTAAPPAHRSASLSLQSQDMEVEGQEEDWELGSQVGGGVLAGPLSGWAWF